MTGGRLNLFQKTMLQWNLLHPYNAVHVVRLAGALRSEQVQRAVTSTLERHGLAGLALDRKRGIYRYHGGRASLEIPVIPIGEHPKCALESEIERQINTPFTIDTPFVPFRFFVVPEAECFALGLVYFHAVADADAVVRLFKEIVAGCQGAGPKTNSPPMNLCPSRYDNLLRHRPGVVARRLAALPRFVRNMRRSSRPPVRDPNDFQQAFTFFSLNEADFSMLRTTSKEWGVTIHDVLLALMLKGVASLAPARTRTRRRREFSVGTIVNTRRDLGLDGTGAFGLFLGSFVVTHPVPAGISIRQLAGDIRQQTERIKRGRLYLGTPLELATVRLALSFFSTAGKRKFYEKHYPLWGGITNMNLNTLWSQQDGGPRPIDYMRAVSTGPATPLVLSVTTIDECVNVGLSYRATVFSADEIARFKNVFLAALRQPEALV